MQYYLKSLVFTMANWKELIHEKSQTLPQQRVWRAKTQHAPRQLICQQQSLLNFVSNDYLGLNGHPNLNAALIKASDQYGTGSTGAPSLSGYTQEHLELSNNLANWLGFEDCLLFNSGYQLNVSLFSQLCDSHTQVWLAKNCHASHIDGILLAKARFNRFNITQISYMQEQIAANPNQRHLIITEGTFSMDGSYSGLAKLIQLKQSYPEQILLIIDDAHGVGALGINGYGSLEQQHLDHLVVDLYVATLGKAFASHGGFVAGNYNLINYLRQSVRSQIFSTMLPATQAAVSNASLKLIQSTLGHDLRQKLVNNITYFKSYSQQLNLKIYSSDLNSSAIQLLILNNLSELTKQHDYLLSQNILTGKIAYPTVAKTQPRLRISLSAAHTKFDIENLVNHLAKHNTNESN